MIRRQAREKALQILFEIDIKQVEAQEVLNERFEEDQVDDKQRDFIRRIVIGTYDNLQAIDEELMKVLEGWNINRIGKVERCILRLAIYELQYSDLAKSIIINEAVELAKVFSTGQSASFINGILAKIIHGETIDLELDKQLIEELGLLHESEPSSIELEAKAKAEKNGDANGGVDN